MVTEISKSTILRALCDEDKMKDQSKRDLRGVAATGRELLMVVHNFASMDLLENMKLAFRPPNTMSFLRPISYMWTEKTESFVIRLQYIFKRKFTTIIIYKYNNEWPSVDETTNRN